jgi:hypothetical protein
MNISAQKESPSQEPPNTKWRLFPKMALTILIEFEEDTESITLNNTT